MSLNNSYNLYFPRDKFGEVIQAIAAMHKNVVRKQALKLFMPDYAIDLPFTGNFKSDIIYFRNSIKHLDFEVTLNFEVDNEIEEYIDETRKAFERHGACIEYQPEFDDRGRYPLGHMHMGVHMDLDEAYALRVGQDAIEFSFTAPTTRMSTLFARSRSIPEAFVDLLEQYDGIAGYFDDGHGAHKAFWYAPAVAG